MNPLRSALLVCALVGASFSLINAEDPPKQGRGEKIAVDTLPEAVKATFAKEAPEAKEVYKSNRDGKVSYRIKIAGADGKNLMLVVDEAGAVVSKEPAKERPKN
jgi:hypothetical protein